MMGHTRNMMHTDYWFEIPEGEFNSALQKNNAGNDLALCSLTKAGYYRKRRCMRRSIIDAWHKIAAGERVTYEESKSPQDRIVPVTTTTFPRAGFGSSVSCIFAFPSWTFGTQYQFASKAGFQQLTPYLGSQECRNSVPAQGHIIYDLCSPENLMEEIIKML